MIQRAPPTERSGAPRAQRNGAATAADRELFLVRLRYREGRPVSLAANNPLLLDDPELAWVVFSGTLEVFAVDLDTGGIAGVRRHLFQATDGTALFGMTVAGGAAGLLASGGPGTRLVRIKRANLARLAENSELVGLVAELIEPWVAGLLSALVRGLPPREPTHLTPDAELEVTQRRCLQPRDGALWVAHQLGSSRLLGRPELSFGVGDPPAPLAGPGWLETTGPARVAAFQTTTALAQQAAWPALDRFHQLALACLARDAEERAKADRERLDQRDAIDRARLADACSRLASIVASTFDAAPIDTTRRDPVLAACQVVGKTLDVQFTPPAGAGSSPSLGHRLTAIARASRVRLRTVALRGAWWTSESGPLLGVVRAEDGPRPVALLPTAHGYDLLDPTDGSRTRVTATAAGRLDPFATSLYRRFPDRALGVRDLVAFGVWGSGADIRQVVLLAVGTSLLGALVPLVTASLFDRVIPGAQRPLLLQLTGGLAIATVVGALFAVTREIATLRIATRLGGAIQAAVIDRLLDLPVAFFRQYTAGDLAGRALAIDTLQQLLSGAALSGLLSGLLSLSSVFVLFVLDARLALVAAGLALVLLVALGVAGQVQLGWQRQIGGLSGRLAGTMLQLINGVAKVRVAGAESRAFALWAGAFAEQQRVAIRARRAANGLAVFLAIYPIAASMVVFACVAIVLQPRPSTGTLLAVIVAFGQLVAAMTGVMHAFNAIVQAVPTYERARPILQSPPEVDATRVDPGELSGAIDVDHVSFRYSPGGPLVLDDVSVHFRPGEFVAIVGLSGSGKSTLLRLLLGFEAPEAGTILYDGQDLAMLDLRAVRRQIGSVLQSSRLASGDLLSNIVGASMSTFDDALEAARLAGLEEDLHQMPMGLHTPITQGTGTLSGGQRQRVLIARAMVTRPRMLLFDEATSALDNRSQALVSRSLHGLAATRVVIAHRLSTIVNADRIYVLQAGRVAESGTYRELTQRRGLFADLARRQIT